VTIQRIEGLFRLRTPAHQGGDEKTGMINTLHRTTVFVDGELHEVPYVSGNSIRGKFRRRLGEDFFGLLGYEPVKNPLPSERLYYLLKAGGGGFEQIRGQQAGVIDLALRSKIREMFPIVDLLGGSLGNQPIESTVDTFDLLPICQEVHAVGGIPDEFLEARGIDATKLPSFYNLTYMDYSTHKDDLRDYRDDQNSAPDEKRPSVQMKYETELFARGIRFYHRWILKTSRPETVGAFWRGIRLFLEDPTIGGGSAKGWGECDISYDGYEEGLDAPYLEFVGEEKDEIRAFITELGKVFK